MSVTVSQEDYTIGDANQPNPVVTGAPSGATITYRYYRQENGAPGTEVTTPTAISKNFTEKLKVLL